MIRRFAVLTVATVASLSVVAPAMAENAVYGGGYSNPVNSDSKYPTIGNSKIDVLSYDLRLHWKPSTRMLRGTATVKIRPIATARTFTLRLGHSLSVSKVLVGKKAATFTHKSKYLKVATPLVVGKPVTAVITYSGTPHAVAAPTNRQDLRSLGWHTTGAGQVWTMQEPYGAYTWYPVNDQPSDKAMYTVHLNVPDKFVGVSNGRMTQRKHVGIREVTTFTNGRPMASYLLTVAIGPYAKYSQKGPGGLPLTYWYPKGQRQLLTALKSTPAELGWLERVLGRYPFGRAGVVVVPAASAIETQTLVTLGQGNYKYGTRYVRETVLHELVHSWYGDSVTPGDWSDLWMNEGFAMYLEAKYSTAKHWKPWSYWRNEFTRNDNYWRWLYGPPGDYKPQRFAQINVYYCTALMLDRLRAKLGSPTFYKLLADWPKANAYTSKDRADFIDFVNSQTGQNLTSWFDAWLDGKHTGPS